MDFRAFQRVGGANGAAPQQFLLLDELLHSLSRRNSLCHELSQLFSPQPCPTITSLAAWGGAKAASLSWWLPNFCTQSLLRFIPDFLPVKRQESKGQSSSLQNMPGN